jgi:hypothetical protein
VVFTTNEWIALLVSACVIAGVAFALAKFASASERTMDEVQAEQAETPAVTLPPRPTRPRRRRKR